MLKAFSLLIFYLFISTLFMWFFFSFSFLLVFFRELGIFPVKKMTSSISSLFLIYFPYASVYIYFPNVES